MCTSMHAHRRIFFKHKLPCSDLIKTVTVYKLSLSCGNKWIFLLRLQIA